MTVTWWRCALTIGRWYSPNSGHLALALWGEPFVNTRIPWLYNLRTDPFERATITSNTYWDWYMDHAFIIMPTQTIVQEFLATFKEYPPRQKAASFTIDQILQQMTSSLSRDWTGDGDMANYSCGG
jgi:hypothetical protein